VDQEAKTRKITPAGSFFSRHWRGIALIVMLLLAGIAIYNRMSSPHAAIPPPAESRSPTVVTSQPLALPSCALAASPGTIIFGDVAHLTWSSSDAVDAAMSPNIGLVGPSGSFAVSPKVTTTYYFVVTGASGVVAESSVTVRVTGAPTDVKITPAVGSIIASPANITRKGELATIAWNSTDATHVVITPSIGIVPLQGRIQVAPAVTTKYTITLNNDTGDSPGRTSAIVYVQPDASAGTGSPPATRDALAGLEIGVSPATIRPGETAHLEWSSIDASMLALNPIVGSVGPRGSMVVSPKQTTRYTLRGWSASGDPATTHVTLTVQ
jgi:hypothetical protein